MILYVIENAGIETKTLQFESLEDYNKFKHDFENLRFNAEMWPGRPLEVNVPYAKVSISKSAGPTTVEKVSH